MSRRIMQLSTLLPLALISALLGAVGGFVLSVPRAPSRHDAAAAHRARQHRPPDQRSPRNSWRLGAVTEDDVMALVEKAESLWADALEARKTANALSDRAEEEAEAAATEAEEADAGMKEGAISLEKIAAADRAANSNLDAGNMVDRAVQAAEEADRLEEIAEEALRASEEALDQHIKDFPDSPLAE